MEFSPTLSYYALLARRKDARPIAMHLVQWLFVVRVQFGNAVDAHSVRRVRVNHMPELVIPVSKRADHETEIVILAPTREFFVRHCCLSFPSVVSRCACRSVRSIPSAPREGLLSEFGSAASVPSIRSRS